MSRAISTVKSLDDLVARCSVASERKIGRSPDPLDVVLQLGLPAPGEITNAQLKELKPLYMDLIRNVRELGESSPYLRPLFETSRDEPDAAIVLLYFLEYPALVRGVRGDVSGISKRSVNEAFDLVDISDAIAKDKTIGPWCRKALASSEEHHFLVLASCISLLHSIARLPLNKAKKCYKKIVFEGETDVMVGFQLLRSHLATIVERPDVSRDAAVNAVLFQSHLLIKFFGEDAVPDMMKEAPNKEIFEGAIKRHRQSFDEGQYQMFRGLLGCSISDTEVFAAAASNARPIKAEKDSVVCEKDGCSYPGTYRCTKCKLVSYCSKECQVADWKPNHKRVCTKAREASDLRSRSVQEATVAARSMHSPALDKQNKFLSENPTIDYRIVLPSGDQDVGCIFNHPMGKITFTLLRSKAAESPFAVYRMYDFLIGTHPTLKTIIRHQLEAEYGVDPLSEEAKNGDPSSISEEEVAQAMQNLFI